MAEWNNILERVYPQGTLAEIDAEGLPRNTTGSCSLPSKDSLGCPWFAECRFREHRGKTGPVNIAIYTELAPAEGGYNAIREAACHEYYSGGYSKRAENAKKSEEIILVVAVEGDGKKIKRRVGTEKEHKKRDPDCDACLAGRCHKLKDVYDEAEVEPFQRPGTKFAARNVGRQMLHQMVENEEKEMQKQMVERARVRNAK